MSEQESKSVREPKARTVVIGGCCLVIAAGILAFSGIRSRATGEKQLAEWTVDQATPTVRVISPQEGGRNRNLVLPGDIQAFSSAPIYARASGYVKAWHKDLGDQVKKGDVLAEIDTPDLDQQYAQAKADMANAEASAALAAATAKRYHVLVGQSIVSQQTDDEKQADAKAKQAALESSKANLARLEALVAFKTLTAPFDGIVTSRSVDVGSLIAGGGSGNALFQVSDVHRVRVYVRVPQAYVGELRQGLTAELEIPQYPGRKFEATLVGTSNAIAQDSRTALVQLQAENPEGKLWPGTFTEIHFHLPADKNVVRVPATALLFGEKGIRVATVDDKNTLVFKNVQLGQDIGSEIEIMSGLSTTDRVVDAPIETLNNGDSVRIADAAPGKPSTPQR